MALKPGERFTEDIHDETMQVKMIKPVPGVGNCPLLTRLKRVNFPPAKGYATCGGGLLCQKLSQQPGMVNREAIGTILTQSHSDPGSQWVQLRKAGSHSQSALSWPQQIKSGQLSLLDVDKCRETLWSNCRIWEHNGLGRMTTCQHLLPKLCTQPWSVEEGVDTNGETLSIAVLDLANV